LAGFMSDVVWAVFGPEEWNKKCLYPCFRDKGLVGKEFDFEDRDISFYWPEKED